MPGPRIGAVRGSHFDQNPDRQLEQVTVESSFSRAPTPAISGFGS